MEALEFEKTGKPFKYLIGAQLTLLVFLILDAIILLCHFEGNWLNTHAHTQTGYYVPDPQWAWVRFCVNLLDGATSLFIVTISVIVFYRVYTAIKSSEAFKALEAQVYAFAVAYFI